MTVADAPLSPLTCARWNVQMLLAAEAASLPPHVINMTVQYGRPTIEEVLRDHLMQVPESDDAAERAAVHAADYQGAAWRLLCLGLGFRLCSMLLLGLGKYSQGGGYLAQLRYVARRALFVTCGHIGKDLDGGAADPDAAEAEQAVLDQVREPSRTFAPPARPRAPPNTPPPPRATPRAGRGRRASATTRASATGTTRRAPPR